MAKGSGGTKGAVNGNKAKQKIVLMPNKNASSHKDWTTAVPLTKIPDKDLYNEVMEGIAKFESVFGMDEHQKNIMLADLGDADGTTYSDPSTGTVRGILLKKENFSLTKEQYIIMHNRATESISPTIVKTDHPAQTTVVHELGHTLWNSKWTGYSTSADGKKIQKAFMDFKKDFWKKSPETKGWGSYATYSANEFFAEGIAKHLLGKPDKYTKIIMEAAKASDKNLKK